jgi:N-methylhydantoinase A
MAWWVGVDVGGTFTDMIAIDSTTRRVQLAKVPTTLNNQADGILAAIAETGVALDEIDVIVHGTTTGTNAVLERKGSRAGLVTTSGFRDVLELGRRTRPNLYGLGGEFTPLIPRDLRFEVDGRVDSLGGELVALDEEGLRAALSELLRRECESVAISFVNSYVNTEQEARAAEIAREMWPNEFVSVGSEILPQIREFERATTTALNAMLQPLITRYLHSLIDRLGEAGYGGRLFVTQANGGVADGAGAGAKAVHTVLSGPAAGVTAAAEIGVNAGFRNVISGDMGGTSFDVAMIVDGQPSLTSEKSIAYKIPLRVPAIDIVTVGSGGGSIAWVDRSGILRVGPESAGSYPGPVAYGRGGQRPTITDANVWLGRLDVSRLPGIESEAALSAVEAALREHVGDPLGLSVDDAAASILRVANDAMAGAMRLVSIERGADPREFAYMSFGGAGPLHAVPLARELGIPWVIMPRRPGLTSALGCLVADVRRDFVRSVPLRMAAVEDVATFTAWMDELEQGGMRELAEQGLTDAPVDVEYRLDMRYEGQFHVVSVRFDRKPASVAQVLDAFEATYRELYGASMTGLAALVSAVGTTVIARRPSFDLSTLSREMEKPRSTGSRSVWFDGQRVEVPVFDRLALAEGEVVRGPAIIEQGDSTLVLEPDSEGTVDRDGNLIIATQSGGRS